jgi:hypothetical protein
MKKKETIEKRPILKTRKTRTPRKWRREIKRNREKKGIKKD